MCTSIIYPKQVSGVSVATCHLHAVAHKNEEDAILLEKGIAVAMSLRNEQILINTIWMVYKKLQIAKALWYFD